MCMCACGSLTNQFACSSNVRTYQASLYMDQRRCIPGKPLRFLKIVPFLEVSLFSLIRHRRHWGWHWHPLMDPLISHRTMPMSHPLGEMCPMEQRTGLVDTTGQCTAYRYNKIPVTGAHNKPPCQLHSLDRIMSENPLFGAAGRVNDAL
jgi:hypothetical protein